MTLLKDLWRALITDPVHEARKELDEAREEHHATTIRLNLVTEKLTEKTRTLVQADKRINQELDELADVTSEGGVNGRRRTG